MKVLFVIPSLEFGGAARQLTLLASGLPADQFTRRLYVWRKGGPWAEVLRNAGVEVEVFGRRHEIYPGPLGAFDRALDAFRPDVIHAWQVPSSGLGNRAALVTSWPLRLRRYGSLLNWASKWLLRRCAVVTVPTAYEAERCRQQGLRPDQVVVIGAGVAIQEPASQTPEDVRAMLNLPASARFIVGIGPLEPHKGFRDAVWTLDILRGLYGDLHLMLIGRGPDRFRLEQFARAIECSKHLHFAEDHTDVAPLLGAAEMVWVPDRVEASLNAALEAMAAGRPVVASRLPGLAEVVTDGESGLLFPPGDKAALARQTRRLLDDAGLRQRLGVAGRERAVRHFAAGAMVRRFTELYGTLR